MRIIPLATAVLLLATPAFADQGAIAFREHTQRQYCTEHPADTRCPQRQRFYFCGCSRNCSACRAPTQERL